MADWIFLLDSFLTHQFYLSKYILYCCASKYVFYFFQCYVYFCFFILLLYNSRINLNEIVKNKQTYSVCCLGPDKIYHNILPIQIGSYIDFLIRRQDVYKNQHQFGYYIINGEYVNIPAFWANNTNGIHSVKQKNSITTSWTLYHKNVNYIISLGENDELFVRELNLTTNTIQTSTIKEAMAIVNLEYTKHNLPTINEDILKYQFTKIRNNPIELDWLSNKIIITAPEIHERVYRSIIYNTKQKNIALVKRLFEQGNVYFVLNKKIFTGMKFKFTNQNKKVIYDNQSGSCQSNSIVNTKQVKRLVSEGVKKSKALLYPEDGKYFLCPINSKELEGSGESIEFSIFTIISVPTKIESVYKFLKTNPSSTEFYWVMIMDFILDIKIDLCMMETLKREFPMISYILYDDIVKIQTFGGVPLKYCSKYDFLISPFEKKRIWCDAFSEYNEKILFDINSQHMRDIIRVMPSKANVSRANNKNKATTLKLTGDYQNDINYNIFIKTGGNHSAIIDEPLQQSPTRPFYDYQPEVQDKKFETIKNYVLNLFDEVKGTLESFDPTFAKELSVFLQTNKPPKFQQLTFMNLDVMNEDRIQSFLSYISNREPKYFDIPTESFTKNELVGLAVFYKFAAILIKGKSTNIITLPSEAPNSQLVTTNLSTNINNCHDLILLQPIPKQKIPRYEIKMPLYDKLLPLFSRTDKFYHDNVYVAFGDICGGTVEDGIVMDSDYHKIAPRTFLSNTFKLQIKKHKDDATVSRRYCKENNIYWVSVNENLYGEFVFGYVYSKVPLSFIVNQSIKKTMCCIKNVYCYCISYINMLPKDLQDLNITSVDKMPNIYLHFDYKSRLGIGNKIANFFGQKNIICKIENLDKFSGYTIDNRWVKPAFLYPVQSIYGRLAFDQMFSGLIDKQTGIQMNGSLIVAIPIIIHEIFPASKLQYKNVRVDLWTDVNGFINNSLPSFIKMSKNQTEQNQTKQKNNLKVLTSIMSLSNVGLKFL